MVRRTASERLKGMSKRNYVSKPETEEVKYPYVTVKQYERNMWWATLYVKAGWNNYFEKKFRTQAGAERWGKRQLAKWHRKYDGLTDPYRIR